MDMSTLRERFFSNFTEGKKQPNGDWLVKVTIIEKVTLLDGQTKEEEIQAECQASDFNIAQQEALAAALYELNDSVLNKGYSSLVEAREVERKLEEQNDSKAEVDETTPTQ